MLTGLAASALTGLQGQGQTGSSHYYLEVKTWFLHNSAEGQAARVATFLQSGLQPALARTGAKLIGAFNNLIGPDGPYYVTLTQYESLAGMQDTLARLEADDSYIQDTQRLAAGGGLPFVRIDSSLLKSFGPAQPVITDTAEKRLPRVFELRTYESQSLSTLRRKVGMFNGGEIAIFQRLGMRPVFFGETIVGPKQPNLMYMLSYDSLDARDKLWAAFAADSEWAKLKAKPELSDSEIVANISNVILRPLVFSPVR